MAESPALAVEVAAILQEVLGENLIGAYLHGSAALGGLRGTSDIDVLAVVERPLNGEERRSIVDRMLDVSGRRARRGPGRPVELTIAVQSDVRPWHYPPMSEFQYGEWLRDDYESGLVPLPERSPDLATLITMALAGNHALVGPPPAEVFDRVPLDDLRRAIVAGIPGLFADLESDTRNVLLTLARIWSTLATGEISTKEAAAEWALPRLSGGHRAVLARARDLYLAGTDDEVGWASLASEARALAGAMVSEIAGLAPD